MLRAWLWVFPEEAADVVRSVEAEEAPSLASLVRYRPAAERPCASASIQSCVEFVAKGKEVAWEAAIKVSMLIKP